MYWSVIPWAPVIARSWEAMFSKSYDVLLSSKDNQRKNIFKTSKQNLARQEHDTLKLGFLSFYTEHSLMMWANDKVH